DAQTEQGKAPAGVLRMARETGCRAVVIAGGVAAEVQPAADLVYSLSERAGGVEEAMSRAAPLLEEAAADAARAVAEEA
ncbi:MAG: glycerate kinase, partial [Actinomycetota bacterium]